MDCRQLVAGLAQPALPDANPVSLLRASKASRDLTGISSYGRTPLSYDAGASRSAIFAALGERRKAPFSHRHAFGYATAEARPWGRSSNPTALDRGTADSRRRRSDWRHCRGSSRSAHLACRAIAKFVPNDVTTE